MQLFKVTYRLRSPLGLRSAGDDPWQADTIFGHLCWALRHQDGEEDLTAFLDLYREGNPPFILSNGFPEGYLPRPIMPFQPTPLTTKKESVQALRAAKEAREVEWLAEEEFGQAIQGIQIVPGEVEGGKLPEPRVTLKNQISRITGTTGEEGNLFHFAEVFYSAVSIYVKVAEGFVEDAERLFSFVARQGYGKRKSVGYGEIDFESFTFEPFPGFGAPADANGFVSLSNFVPAKDDPTRGAWRTTVKYGKLGEEYALHEHPFKRPLIMLLAGCSFYAQPCQEYYGRLVESVSASHPEVVQYGLAFPVPAVLPREVFL